MEYSFIFSYILVLVALFYSYREKLGVERELLYSSVRAFIQLLILGYALNYIFKLQNFAGLMFILFCMVIFAGYTAQKRVNLKENGLTKAVISIGLSSAIVLFSLMFIGVVKTKPNEIIPVGGMIIGNALNVYSLTVDRLKGEIKNNLQVIEEMVSLGASLKKALGFIKKHAVKSALIPVVNTLQTVGIIHIPGITTGMLLAGASPLQAVSYQLAILYMLVAVALFTSVITINTVYKESFKTAVM